MTQEALIAWGVMGFFIFQFTEIPRSALSALIMIFVLGPVMWVLFTVILLTGMKDE
jgi:hypothetical protein